MEELKKVFLRPVGEVALPILTSKGPLRNLQTQNFSSHHCLESVCLCLFFFGGYPDQICDISAYKGHKDMKLVATLILLTSCQRATSGCDVGDVARGVSSIIFAGASVPRNLM